MKIREVLQEFVPCEVCGNRDINLFYFHVFVHKGSQPFVKCCECEEEYYSTKARKILTKVENAFKVRTHLDPAIESGNYQRHDLPHPLLKALSGI
ncbi:MAG: hypothetical protein KKA10_00570 [Euryarchaeota archaeon]|nr:hypothetical protein [Euryarchaeota archaeon]MBU4453584.1 hypothetical protein [Euryarchaeota archaeon]MCG2738505.1 hypothetical protein [Candidatus Methanoperedenaceae archaeon]MDP3103233.1 hypothetical protein [Candidatus Methanoperedens sp.]